MKVIQTVVFATTLAVLFLPADSISQVRSISRVSVSSSEVEGNAGSDQGTLSEDGSIVAFRSSASNLVSSDTNSVADIFIRNISSGTTTRVSINNSFVEGNGESGVKRSDGRSISISGDGNFVAYASSATNLVSGDTNGSTDIFVRNVVAQTTTRASVQFTSLESDGASSDPSISDDGESVAFLSDTTTFTSDFNGASDVYKREEESFISNLISVSELSLPGDGASEGPSMSNSGRNVVFASSATDLVPSDTNGFKDIFIRDTNPDSLSTGRISLSNLGAQANGDSRQPVISAEGGFVAFVSAASNLVNKDFNGAEDVFVYDVSSGFLELVSKNSRGASPSGASFSPSISGDGRYVAFISNARLVSEDRNGVADCYLYDRTTGKYVRINLSEDGNESKTACLDVSISRDGRFAKFSSVDSTLVSGDTNSVADVFIVEPSKVLTPDTTLDIAPSVDVVSRVTEGDATIVMQEFSAASIEVDTAILGRLSRVVSAARRTKLVVRYDVEVEGSGTAAGQFRRATAKRNEFTFKRLPAGSYTSRYRAKIVRVTTRKNGTKRRRTIFTTNSSPSAGFNVGS